MQFYYIKFEAPEYPEKKGDGKPKYNKLKLFSLKIFVNILKGIIPIANPDYERKIDKVKFWLLEFIMYPEIQTIG